nr:Protein neuralized like [Ipomoea batatas]
MAVAGLHNVSAFDSSFLGESQSPVSGRWGEQEMPSTQASTILQMWRELEGERVVSNSVARYVDRDGQLRSEGSNPDSIVLENEHHDGTSVVSDQSTDFTEIERERVRQVFKEWKNNGVKSHSMNNTIHINNQSRAEWLGENECERVRVVREWVQMNIQQRGTNTSHRDERCAEIGSQIEQVRDGMPVNRSETGERRGLRRLCGRQALLDLLLKAQRQRKKELQWLMERRPVSDFAYRNRIQSLLRGRFLRNERSILDEKPASVAASELGVLRQRQTVSDLRYAAGPLSMSIMLTVYS